MLKPSPRIIAFPTVLSLLTLATSASAECAWVLWAGYGGKSTMNGPVMEFSPYFGAATQSECATALKKAQETNEARHGPLAPFFFHVCLPDTVDPRGVKGK